MKHNFNAGPCVLPKQAVEAAIEAIRDFDNTGIGILEISHRTPGWERVMAEVEQLWRDLLNIPDDYAVFFVGGGASTQFFQVPANLLKTKAAYLQTGVWAKKAAKEAKFYGDVEIVASSEDKTYSYIPKNFTIPTDVDYFHITTNNTIYGTEIHEDIDSPCPGLTHRYPDRVLFLITDRCAAYCRHCTRRRMVGQTDNAMPKEQIDALTQAYGARLGEFLSKVNVSDIKLLPFKVAEDAIAKLKDYYAKKNEQKGA